MKEQVQNDKKINILSTFFTSSVFKKQKKVKDYADNILEKVEGALQDALRTIENNRRELK